MSYLKSRCIQRKERDLRMAARMRTIDGCVQQLKAEDPETQITKHALRQLVISQKIKSVRVGVKYLIDYDALLAYLSDPPEIGEEKEEYQQYGKLRKIQG